MGSLLTVNDFGDAHFGPNCPRFDLLVEIACVALAKLKQERRFKALSETAEQQRQALPEELINKITEMGGTGITPIIEKRLFKTDLSKQHNRLSMPSNKLRNADFLREREVQAYL